MLQYGNFVFLTITFLDMEKFTTPLSFLILCKLLFPTVGLKISSLPTLTLKSPNKFSYGMLGAE
jgi:hypothetical protein